MPPWGWVAPITMIVGGVALAIACAPPQPNEIGGRSPAHSGSSSGSTSSGSSSGDAGTPPNEPIKPGKSQSCTKGGPGADKSCGNNLDCCESKPVPGGTFNRFNDNGFPATVSP